MSLPGFEDGRHDVGSTSWFVARGGDGPPVLLLHGFPQTHVCWRRVAPRLAAAGRTVMAPDLRGYGASTAPAGGPHGEGYTKREVSSSRVRTDQLADAPEVWRRWADDLTAARVPGGHFLPEEAPDALTDLLRGFLRPSPARADEDPRG